MTEREQKREIDKLMRFSQDRLGPKSLGKIYHLASTFIYRGITNILFLLPLEVIGYKSLSNCAKFFRSRGLSEQENYHHPLCKRMRYLQWTLLLERLRSSKILQPQLLGKEFKSQLFDQARNLTNLQVWKSQIECELSLNYLDHELKCLAG